jgi:hypothetical protein
MSSTDQGSAVDSQVSDTGVHVDGGKTWTDAVVATFRPSDHHVSDDEIFEILNAGSDGETATDLCAAKGVTIPMYCVWKTKYRHLTLDEVRKVRRRERWRGRCLLSVLLAAAVLGTAGIVFGLVRAAYPNITVATGLTPADLLSTSAPMSLESLRPGTGGATHPGLAPSPGAPPGERQSRSDAPASIIEPGYKVQVAAPASLQEGRVFLERLASAGYPAYLSRAIVSDIEVFRVRVGPFDTRLAAEEITSQLQREGYYGAWIAR